MVSFHSESLLFESARCGNEHALMMALTFGADVNARDPSYLNCTAAMMAAHAGHAQCLSILTHWGALLDAANPNNLTAALLASGAGQAECLQMLINSNVDIDAQNSHGDTPAILAALRGHANCLSMLIRAGCNLALKNSVGQTVTEAAAVGRNSACMQLIHAEAERHALFHLANGTLISTYPQLRI